MALDLPRPKAENANTSGSALPSHKVMGYGGLPPCLPIALDLLPLLSHPLGLSLPARLC